MKLQPNAISESCRLMSPEFRAYVLGNSIEYVRKYSPFLAVTERSVEVVLKLDLSVALPRVLPAFKSKLWFHAFSPPLNWISCAMAEPAPRAAASTIAVRVNFIVFPLVVKK